MALTLLSSTLVGPFPVGNGPFWVTAGDFNGDGKKDLATSNRGSNDVSVLLGNGDGTFQAARSFPAGGGASYVGVGDFNRDGIQDLVTADYNTGTVSVLRGVGDGTFLAPQSFPAGGINPNCLAVGELNGDGAQDLAVAVFGGNTPDARTAAVLLGTGTGAFQPAVSYSAERGPLWVELGDLNGDGKQDMLVANFGQDTMSLLLGNGDGTFQTERSLPGGACSAPPCGAAALAVGDFNGDGLQDLVIVDYYSFEVAVMLGNGDATFAAPVAYHVGPPSPATSSPATVAVADFNDDGVLDLAVPNWTYNTGDVVSLLAGNGNGTFQATQDVTVLGGDGVLGVVAADFNGDGKPDLALSNYAGNTVSVLINASGPPSGVSLTVTKSGTGSGTVTSSPAGINCGSTCTASYNSGTVVTLTAAASGGSTFSGWSGGGCSGTGACSVTMNAAATVAATFTAPAQQFSLTVSKAGTGTGTVTSNPAGINCGSTCSASYNSGTVVTLTAAAAGGSTFSGWSGGGCSGTGTCSVTMSAAATVTASFAAAPQRFNLTVSKAGTGSGTVTSNPAGINCGSTCTATYNAGTVVTLTASAAAGSTFSGWSGGGCSGTGTCSVPVNSTTAVSATFTRQQFTLTVTHGGLGLGTVSSSPAGINNCSGTCSATFDGGTVTLTATPGLLSGFVGWSGGCTGSGTTCTLNLNTNTTVTATFKILGVI